MLTTKKIKCTNCDNDSQVYFHGYAQNYSDIELCKFHALQLARKLLEDVCDLEGDRHG